MLGVSRETSGSGAGSDSEVADTADTAPTGSVLADDTTVGEVTVGDVPAGEAPAGEVVGGVTVGDAPVGEARVDEDSASGAQVGQAPAGEVRTTGAPEEWRAGDAVSAEPGPSGTEDEVTGAATEQTPVADRGNGFAGSASSADPSSLLDGSNAEPQVYSTDEGTAGATSAPDGEAAESMDSQSVAEASGVGADAAAVGEGAPSAGEELGRPVSLEPPLGEDGVNRSHLAGDIDGADLDTIPVEATIAEVSRETPGAPAPGAEEAGIQGAPAGYSADRISPVSDLPSPLEDAGPPVDSAVDERAETGPDEREMRSSEAGENSVDDRIGDHRFGSRTADREVLGSAVPVEEGDAPHASELTENTRRHIQLTGRPFPKPVAPRVLTVANQKGGVGKTTTTVNVAAALAQSGLRALVIDLDPQGNASTALGIDHHAEVPSIYDVLVEGTPLLEVIQPCTTVDNLYCAPATIDLAGAEIELVSLVARESRLQKAIVAATETGHSFDYILIDCPPSLGLLTVNAMVAASEVFIPIQCEYYALEGLSQLLKNIELVKSHLNPPLHVSTILLTMYDGRTRLSAQVADEVREHFPEQVLRTTVPRSVRVSEAPSFGETVMTYDPTSSGALAYLEAAGELADRGAEGRV
jgi:chromosome partitioning protein